MKAAVGHRLSAIGFGGCFAVMLVFVAACGPRGEERRVKNAVRAFYEVYMRVRPSGVPTQAQQLEFKKVVSTGLMQLLDQAATVEDTSRDASSAASPRLEGDVFTSVDEGAATYKIVDCEIQTASAACMIELTNPGADKDSKLLWNDRLFLVREGDRWAVDDIEFMGGEEEFMHQGRLKDVLKQVIEDAKLPAV